MKLFFKKITFNRNIFLLLLTLICILVAIVNPKIKVTRDIYNYIFVVDISQSMMTQDMEVAGKKTSRLEYTKKTIQNIIEKLPCKTKVSIGMFAGVSVAATYTPIEVCDNFSSINKTIDHLDWRSTWSGNTRIRESAVNLARLIRSFPEAAQVVFFTDGEEAPKLHVFNTRDLNQFQGGTDWLYVGIGSDVGTPIPKYDAENQLIGFWSNESFALQPGIAQISEGNIGARNDAVATSENDRYLSKLDEKYLVSLAKEIKGVYVKGDDIENIISQMKNQKASWRDRSDFQLRNIFALIALIFFIMRFVTMNKIKVLLNINKYVKS